jgi:hypothetical protein
MSVTRRFPHLSIALVALSLAFIASPVPRAAAAHENGWCRYMFAISGHCTSRSSVPQATATKVLQRSLAPTHRLAGNVPCWRDPCGTLLV